MTGRRGGYFDVAPAPPVPRPALTLVAGGRGGKTALQWHQLRRASVVAGRPIVCVRCEQPHERPPPLGRCACGGFSFGLQSDQQLPLQLEAPPHG